MLVINITGRISNAAASAGEKVLGRMRSLRLKGAGAQNVN
jgi:hypothetical protein